MVRLWQLSWFTAWFPKSKGYFPALYFFCRGTLILSLIGEQKCRNFVYPDPAMDLSTRFVTKSEHSRKGSSPWVLPGFPFDLAAVALPPWPPFALMPYFLLSPLGRLSSAQTRLRFDETPSNWLSFSDAVWCWGKSWCTRWWWWQEGCRSCPWMSRSHNLAPLSAWQSREKCFLRF